MPLTHWACSNVGGSHCQLGMHCPEQSLGQLHRSPTSQTKLPHAPVIGTQEHVSSSMVCSGGQVRSGHCSLHDRVASGPGSLFQQINPLTGIFSQLLVLMPLIHCISSQSSGVHCHCGVHGQSGSSISISESLSSSLPLSQISC